MGALSRFPCPDQARVNTHLWENRLVLMVGNWWVLNAVPNIKIDEKVMEFSMTKLLMFSIAIW